jgi:hypothetical protein
MSGPYPTHAAALADVDKARNVADKHDARAWFMAWGTDEKHRPSLVGTLNKHRLMEVTR